MIETLPTVREQLHGLPGARIELVDGVMHFINKPAVAVAQLSLQSFVEIADETLVSLPFGSWRFNFADSNETSPLVLVDSPLSKVATNRALDDSVAQVCTSLGAILSPFRDDFRLNEASKLALRDNKRTDYFRPTVTDVPHLDIGEPPANPLDEQIRMLVVHPDNTLFPGELAIPTTRTVDMLDGRYAIRRELLAGKSIEWSARKDMLYAFSRSGTAHMKQPPVTTDASRAVRARLVADIVPRRLRA